MKKNIKQQTIYFDIIVNGNPMSVIASPYLAVDKQRFRVSYNGGPVHIFGYNENIGEVVLMDSATSAITPDVKNAIAHELTMKAQRMAA